MAKPAKVSPNNITLSELDEARLQWLKGVSLRALAPKYGLTHNQLHIRLRNVYGKDVCNRLANSLTRSLIRDGVDPNVAMTVPMSNERYHSIKQDNCYSKSRMLDFTLALELLYDEPATDLDWLKLPSMLYWLEEVVNILRICYTNGISN
jgi:hypothetical protein